jgi:hypothetical protein
MSERFSMPPESIGTRHSIRPNRQAGEKSDEKYFGLSERGVELAKERAADILSSLEDSEPGTVMAFIGATEADRTKATTRVYGDEISRLVQEQERQDIRVITEDVWKSDAGVSENVQSIAREVGDNPNTKYLLTLPLQMKEFRLQERWQNSDGSWANEYAKKLFEDNNFDNQKVIETWLSSQGELGDLRGPNPAEVAEEELSGLARAKDFITKLIPNRPIRVGFVGHGPNIDALAIYLANEGKVDLDGFRKIQSRPFGETDMIDIKNDSIVLPTGEYII